MKVLFDTSVLVAALVESHVNHEQAHPWLNRALRGKIKFIVATHTLTELYAVLTKLPLSPRFTPYLAQETIKENILNKAKCIELNTRDTKTVLEKMAEMNLSGGIIYDALIAKAAQKAHVNYLLTFNEKDFLRVWPEGQRKIKVP